MSQSVFNVDATALFNDRPGLRIADLVEHLNGHIASLECGALTASPLTTPDWWLLATEQFHIMVSFSDTQEDPARFGEAATSLACGLTRFDYPHAVATHRAAVRIEIGDGSAPLPPEAREIMQELGDGSACDAELKLMALNWCLQHIVEAPGFLAAHFGPSDRLFSHEEIKAAAAHDLPVSLMLHPVPGLPEPGPGGVQGYPVRLRSAALLDGPVPELEGVPAAIPFGVAAKLLTTLYMARSKGKVAMQHGEIISPSGKWSLYARHTLADAEMPQGRVILSFWKDRRHNAAIRLAPGQKPVQAEEREIADQTPVSEPVAAPDPLPIAARAAEPQTEAAAAPAQSPYIAASNADPQDFAEQTSGLSLTVPPRSQKRTRSSVDDNLVERLTREEHKMRDEPTAPPREAQRTQSPAGRRRLGLRLYKPMQATGYALCLGLALGAGLSRFDLPGVDLVSQAIISGDFSVLTDRFTSPGDQDPEAGPDLLATLID